MTHSVPGRALPAALVPPAALQIRPDSLARALREFRELPRAAVDYGLDLLLGLLRDRHDAVEVLVDEQPHEHLQQGYKNIDYVYFYFKK